MRAALLAILLVAVTLAGCARDMSTVQATAREDEWLEFYCAPYSPCGHIDAHAVGGATGYRLALVPGLRGGYSVEADVRGDTVALGGFGFAPGEAGPFEGRLPAGRAEAWTFVFVPLSGETGGKVTMKVTWLRDGPATTPLCERVDEASLYGAEELLGIVEVQKDSPRDVALCVLERVRTHVVTWTGARYANLSGELNRDAWGAEGGSWSLVLRGDHGGGVDVWHFTIRIAHREASVEGGLSAAGAIPPGEVERARSIFESSADAAEVREHAPHYAAQLTRWEPGQRIVLFYDATPPGSAGIPERPFARVTVDLTRGEVASIERSEWW